VSDYTTISLKKEFVRDVEAYIEDEPFSSPKEFVKHLAVREMEDDGEITEAEARELGRKLAELGYVE
jgi:Arc/MetJ-type ribon-helix-helix transcriptional regulator